MNFGLIRFFHIYILRVFPYLSDILVAVVHDIY